MADRRRQARGFWRAARNGAWLALALAIGVSAHAIAGPQERSASRAIIEQQLDAFQRDAWAEAFEFASPNIKRIFQTPERFSEMVRGGYPMVWRPSSVEFVGAEEVGSAIIQRLRIIDSAGVAFVAQYHMELIGGVWRIAGVFIEKEPEVGV